MLLLVLLGLLLAGPAAAQGPRVLEDVPVTANDLRAAKAQNSPLLAVDPTNLRFVAAAVRLDAPDFSCGLELSGDRGRSWVPARPVPRLPRGAEKCYAPEIAFDEDGTLLYLFLGLRGRGNNPMGVFLTKSEDRGRTFSEPRRILGPGNYMVRMAVDSDGGRIHLVWLRTLEDAPLGGLAAPPNPIVASYSDDGGESFSRAVTLSRPAGQRAVAPALAIGRDHAVHVLHYDLRDDARDYQGLEGPRWEGNWSLVSTSSYDGGKTFAGGVVVNDRVVPPERVMLIYTMPPPAVAADGSGRVYAGWYDARSGDWDVFFSGSSDGARSWGEPIRLNDDPRGNGRHQYLPRLSVAPGGRVDAVFLDRRNDRRNVNNETFFTYSGDGRSFSRNVRLSSAPSNSTSGQIYEVPSAKGLIEFGGRTGLVSDRSRAIAAWTDTRNASAGAYQDVFATQVSFANERAGSGGRFAGWFLALGLVSATALAAWTRRLR